MSQKKSTTTNINQYLKDELRTTEARNFQVEILRDADLLERVFLEKMNKKVSETQIEDEVSLKQIPSIASTKNMMANEIERHSKIKK